MSYFSPNFCAFEVIQIMRITFFCAFNVINTYSIVFVVDETKARIFKAMQTRKRQRKVTKAMEAIYNMQSKVAKVSDLLDLRAEMVRRDYGDIMRATDKEIREELIEMKKTYAPIPWLSMATLKKNMRRLALVGLVLGILTQEVIPRAKKHFDL